MNIWIYLFPPLSVCRQKPFLIFTIIVIRCYTIYSFYFRVFLNDFYQGCTSSNGSLSNQILEKLLYDNELHAEFLKNNLLLIKITDKIPFVFILCIYYRFFVRKCRQAKILFIFLNSLSCYNNPIPILPCL